MHILYPQTASRLARTFAFLCLGLLVCFPVLMSIAAVPAQADEVRELYRIRVLNRTDGAVEVSSDGGQTYWRVGRVLRPATESLVGYLASIYAEPGTVAAVAVHGIRMKVSGGRESARNESKVVSLLPKEFAEAPKGFGGYVAGPSGICTDIPTGQAIFRNLAPFVGNPVFLQSDDRLIPIPASHAVQLGDTFVIVVQVPARYPDAIVFENTVGGHVDMVFPDGTETVAVVEQPVRGVGRFDATGYTGVGRVNTNHTGVLTVSTAPIVPGGKDGSSVETRGGFMVQPSRHAKSADNPYQIMVVGPVSKSGHWLEGCPPLFSGYIGLADDPDDATHSFLVDIKRGGADWTPMPTLVGRNDNAFSGAPERTLTAVRVRFPKLTPEWVASQVRKSAEACFQLARAAAVKRGSVVSGGLVTLSVGTVGPQVRFVNLYVDGIFRGVSNNTPFELSVDTSSLNEGEHVAELSAMDESGATIKSVRRSFFVQRQNARALAD